MSWREAFIRELQLHDYIELPGTEVWLDALQARGWIKPRLIGRNGVHAKHWWMTGKGQREARESLAVLSDMGAEERCRSCAEVLLKLEKELGKPE